MHMQEGAGTGSPLSPMQNVDASHPKAALMAGIVLSVLSCPVLDLSSVQLVGSHRESITEIDI